MKALLVCCLLMIGATTVNAQEIRCYLNGVNIEKEGFRGFSEGSLLRVVFNPKTLSGHRLRIASLLVTVTPVGTGSGLIKSETGFVIANPSLSYSTAPSFTLHLLETLVFLQKQSLDIKVQVQKLEAETPEGAAWLAGQLPLNEVRFLPAAGQ